MFCIKCGSDNLEDAKFCRNCGEPLMEKPETDTAPVFKPWSETGAGAHEPAAMTVQQPAANAMPLTPAVQAKKKSHKGLIVLAAVLLVLAIAGTAAFLLRNTIMKTVMPEQYLQMSIARTAAQSQKGAGKVLDLGKFATGAVKHEFSVDTENDGSSASIDGSFLYDAQTEKALLNVSLESPDEKLKDNVLYISKDQIALSLPSQITDTKFLTVDPATFNDEWKKKGYDDLAEMPDLQELVNAFFGKSEDGKSASAADVKKDFLKFLSDKAEFSTDGTVTENIGGVDRKLDVMTYTISKSDANKRYQDFVKTIEDKMAKAAEMYASDSSQDVSGFFDELESLKVKSNIEVVFYIDQDGYINRLEIKNFKIASDSGSADIGLTVDIWNKDGTTFTSSELSADSGSDSAVLDMDTQSSFKDGVYSFTCDFRSPEADTDVTVDLEWDTKDKKGENMNLVFSVDSEDNVNKATLTGNLVEDNSKISLSDATLDLTTGSESVAKLDLSYSLSKIDASEITADTSDSTPLLSYQPFKDYMDMVLSYQS